MTSAVTGLDRCLSVAVLGASGYAGGELLRLLAGHPSFEVAVVGAERHAGARLADLHPQLAALYPELVLSKTEPALLEGLDVVFAALPHGVSSQLVPTLRQDGKVGVVVDLAADFRLKDPDLYPRWYGSPHPHPELLAGAAFGIPELFRPELVGATLIAAAGCYVTAASLALAPLVRAGLIETTGVVVDAASGVSGAGRDLRENTQFCTVDEDFVAYGLLGHRHTPEIEQACGAQVLFTPHLAPMNRGILATCYARPAQRDPDPLGALEAFYAAEPFVVVSERPPSTKATLGSNCAQLTARYDPRTGWVVALCALDNLTKGAAGQALQCANVALGLPETSGLPRGGLAP